MEENKENPEAPQEGEEPRLGDFLMALDKVVKDLSERVSTLESAFWRVKNSI